MLVRMLLIGLIVTTTVLTAHVRGQTQNMGSIGQNRQHDSGNATGAIRYPLAQQTINGNLLLLTEVTDPEGISAVYLRFNQLPFRQYLCQSNMSCGGDNFSQTVSGIRPADSGAISGELTIALWSVDISGHEQWITDVVINWQPPTIEGIDVTRSADGTSINVNWLNQPGVFRYNLYLAAASGVSQQTFSQLPEGQARLGVVAGPAEFSALNPAHVYYLSIAGIGGGGENTNNPEIMIPLTGNVNQAPTAQNDTANTLVDTTTNINVLANDTDPENDALTITGTGNATGTVTISTEQTLIYTPPPGFTGDDSFTYEIEDGNGGNSQATVTVTVVAENQAPVANNDAFNVVIDTPINLNVLINDLDPEGGPLAVTNVVTQSGTVMIEPDNTLTYTPASGFLGVDVFIYDIQDQQGQADSATVTLTVAQANQAPDTLDDDYQTLVDTPLNVDAASGVASNDSDPENDPLFVDTTPVNGPTNGVVLLNADGSFEYTPNTSFTGIDTFVYNIEDSEGEIAQGTVTIEVNALPAAVEGQSLNITGELLYLGQGETSPGSGIGTALYRIGNCIQDINTLCTMIGQYQENNNSPNSPGGTGTYAFTQFYSGFGDSPVLARSNAPGSNSVFFSNVGDAIFELTLFPETGGVIKGTFPATPISTAINFGAFILPNEQCVGLTPGQNCNIATVGTVPGSQLTAPLDNLTFTIPSEARILPDNQPPTATADDYVTGVNQPLNIAAPGVLENDPDADEPEPGNNLNILSQFNPSLGIILGIGFDYYRQLLYFYPRLETNIFVVDRIGQPILNFNVSGLGVEKLDLDVTPEAFSLGGQIVQQGRIMVINGETGTADIQIVDPVTGVLEGQLNTEFGNGQVVGGAYNPVTKSIFLLQNNMAPVGANQIAEIDPNTGEILQSIDITDPTIDFDVMYGDLDVDRVTGHLFLVSNTQTSIVQLTPQGELVRKLPLPNIADPSTLAISPKRDRVWVSNLNGSAFELKFDNNGTLPQLRAQLVTEPDMGNVTLHPDGSFTYTPQANFTGVDTFTYKAIDASGANSLATVTINVQ